MSYSRRELYALGEPIGDSATYRKVDGGLVLGDGGGDGGGQAAPAPSQAQTTTQELPEWARGYAKDVLAKGQALTDINQNPYQQYTKERVAGFTPLQQQAMQGAAGMQTSGATGQGINVAGQAAQNALNTSYQGGNFYGGQFGNQQAAQYMSPFIQQSLQPQLQEQARQSAILGQENQARAVGQGAFGGSRSALVEAERQRNLATQQGNTISAGLQNAYNAATQQFNADAARNLQAQQAAEQSRQYGAGIGIQGLQTALTGANALGALGTQQFQQGIDINKLQAAYGGQQQALEQQKLSQEYQDFLDRQNYPYKQLSYMSDLVRGTPVGLQSTNQMYQAAPSGISQLAGLGTAGIAGLGLYNATK